jgi:hypothetical protein
MRDSRGTIYACQDRPPTAGDAGGTPDRTYCPTQVNEPGRMKRDFSQKRHKTREISAARCVLAVTRHPDAFASLRDKRVTRG